MDSVNHAPGNGCAYVISSFGCIDIAVTVYGETAEQFLDNGAAGTEVFIALFERFEITSTQARLIELRVSRGARKGESILSETA